MSRDDHPNTCSTNPKHKCPNCGNVYDAAKENGQDYCPDDDVTYINVDNTGATCWNCGYSSEFRDESWRVD